MVKETLGIPQSRLESWIWFSPIPVVEPKSTGGWGPKWASVKVFLEHMGNLPHQQQQHRGLVPGFPNPLPLSEEELERDVPSKEEPRFRCFYSSYLCYFSFNCPVFEWWCSIYNYAEPNMTERERGREGENNELGSWGEYLVFIESRVSGRGFCGLSTPNPFLRCLTGPIVSRFTWKMFPHLTPWGEIWMWDMSECDLGEADGFLQLLCNPSFHRIAPKNLLCIHKLKKGTSQKYLRLNVNVNVCAVWYTICMSLLDGCRQSCTAYLTI